MGFVDEVLQWLSRSTVKALIEQEFAFADNLLAVVLNEQASHRCLSGIRLDVVALPTILAVPALDR
jgi:hypothetical protein